MLAAAVSAVKGSLLLLTVYPQFELLHSLRLPLYTELAALTVTRAPSANFAGRLDTRGTRREYLIESATLSSLLQQCSRLAVSSYSRPGTDRVETIFINPIFTNSL